MTPFDLIDCIITKSPNISRLTDDEINNHSEYLAARYISMMDDRLAILMNETVNKNGFITDKKENFKYLYRVIPKSRRVKYMKKGEKIKKNENDEYYFKLAEIYELSVREVREYCEELKIDTKKIFN